MGLSLSTEENEFFILNTPSDSLTFKNEHFHSQIAKLALIEKGIPFEEKKVDLSCNEYIQKDKGNLQLPVLELGYYRSYSNIISILKAICSENTEFQLNPYNYQKQQQMQQLVKMCIYYCDMQDFALACIILKNKKLNKKFEKQLGSSINQYQKAKQFIEKDMNQTFQEKIKEQEKSQESMQTQNSEINYFNVFKSTNSISSVEQLENYPTKYHNPMYYLEKKIIENQQFVDKMKNLEGIFEKNLGYVRNILTKFENIFQENNNNNQKQQYVLGEQYTQIDVVFTVFLSKLESLGLQREISKNSNVFKYFKEVKQRPSYNQTGLNKNKLSQNSNLLWNWSAGVSLMVLILASASFYVYNNGGINKSLSILNNFKNKIKQ